MNRAKTPHCKYCKAAFRPVKPGAVVCSVECAQALAEKKRQKFQIREVRAQRVEIKKRLNQLKSLSQLAQEAQQQVNRYVRLRDKKKGCCSCDKPATWQGQWHASHYISIGASSALRFHLCNIAKACSQCNKEKSGNLIEYGDRMDPIKRDFLKNHERNRRYSREYLIRIKQIFAKRCRRAEKRIIS